MTGEEFRKIRRELGLSQSVLAKVLGYRSALTISSYERQSARHDVPHLVAMLMKAFESGYRLLDSWPARPRRPLDW